MPGRVFWLLRVSVTGVLYYVLYIELNENRSCRCKWWYILSAVTFLVGAVGLVTVCVISLPNLANYTFRSPDLDSSHLV